MQAAKTFSCLLKIKSTVQTFPERIQHCGSVF